MPGDDASRDTATPVTVAPLQPGDEPGFDALIDIYREAIAASERKPVAAIAAYLRDARYVVLAARDQAQVVGFAIAFFPAGADFWLLDYMAVAHGARSRGIGGVLFRAACAAARSRGGAGPCVIEIDDPRATLSAANKARERIAFYKRQGCRRLGSLSYILPLDVAGTPPLMQLLVHGLADAGSVPKAVVRRWLSTLYAQLYDRACDDPRIDAMLAGAATAIPLDVL